ncbi:MAG TPA: polysaccharide pyruvyl transferase CsaB [Paenibacillaceae bacterium]|nr:polysaccharide pyruvyl transferase CsaB [Paenibacillaceae bacterium]
MTRILISGYYGFDNAGDDSVLFGIIGSLKKQIPNVELAVLSNTPEDTQRLFGIASFNRWKIGTIIQEIKKSDLLVMGGGSLLQDATSPRSVIYYLSIAMIAKILKKPVIFYAQGIGPITKIISKKLVQLIVNEIDVITVRDKESKEDLVNLGVKKVPIHITADPAVMINPSQIDSTKGKEILHTYHKDSSRPIMVICVRSWKNHHEFKKSIACLADEYIRKGWDIFFLPMQNPADLKPSDDIMNLMEEKHHHYLVKERLTYLEIMSFISCCDFVLGIRLHSVILAAALNVPFVGISYDPKIERFVQRLKMTTGGHITNLDYPTLSQQVENIVRNPDQTKELIMQQMNLLVKEAEKSSLLALELLTPPSARKKMKVIHVIGGGEFGGAEQHILELLDIIKTKSTEPKVICFYQEAFAQELKKREIPVFVVDRFGKADIRTIKQLRTIFKQEHPAIIHTHGVRANFLGRLAAHNLGIPIITTIHSVLRYDYPSPLHYFIASRMEFFTRKWNQHYIAISQSIKQILLNEGIKSDKISLIHHGINMDAFHILEEQSKIRQTLGLPEHAFVVGTVSRLVPIKGLNDLIEALAIISEKIPNLHWLAVGDGPEREVLEQLARSKGIEENVHFIGFRKDVPRCLKALDVYVSTSYSEGFGLSVIEAMAAKVPVISTPVGGISDFLIDRVNGLAVPSNRPDEIARSIMYLYENPQLRNKLIEAAYELVSERFTLNNMADKTLTLYQNLNNKKKAATPS